MLAQMRNDALRSVPEAYPQTLTAAFRIASLRICASIVPYLLGSSLKINFSALLASPTAATPAPSFDNQSPD